MTEKIILKSCIRCGSEGVRMFGMKSKWDLLAQKWEIDRDDQKFICLSCGHRSAECVDNDYDELMKLNNFKKNTKVFIKFSRE